MAVSNSTIPRMLVALLCLAAWIPADACDDRAVAEFERKYAVAWARARSLPQTERQVVFKQLLQEAETLSPRPFAVLATLAERADLPERRLEFAREWVAVAPTDQLAQAELVIALSNLGKTDELSMARKALFENSMGDGTSEGFELALSHLLAQNAKVEAGELLLLSAKASKLDTNSKAFLGIRFCEEANQDLVIRTSNPQQPAVALVTLRVIECLVLDLLRESQDYVRTDILSTVFRTYIAALPYADNDQQASAFLRQLNQAVDASGLSETEKKACRQYLDRWGIRFYFHSNRKAEAIERAREIANQAVADYRQSDKTEAVEVLSALQDCLDVFPRGNLRQLMDLIGNLKFDEVSAQAGVLFASENTDEGVLERVRSNQVAWAQFQASYYLRMMREREPQLAKKVANSLSEFLNSKSSSGDSISVLDERDEIWLQGFASFSETLSKAESLKSTERFAGLFDLTGELWLQGEPRLPEQLRGKVVVMSLGTAGVTTDPFPPRTLLEIKAAIDEHLETDGLTGMAPEILADRYLGQLYDAYPRSSLEIIGLIDDDFESMFDDAQDQWHPVPNESTARTLQALRVNHPFVYSHHSKFLDALISEDQPRLIVFDRSGQLVRIIDGISSSCEFETLQMTIERLLQSDPATSPPERQPN